MVNCTYPKFNLEAVEQLVKLEGGAIVEKISAPFFVEKVKAFVETLGLAFTEKSKDADMFILYKIAEDWKLVEFTKGCSEAYLGMGLEGYTMFMNFVEITL